jgi:hypothetical protein
MSSQAGPAVDAKRSKRLYILWSTALTLLLALGLFSWLVVVPVWRVRSIVDKCTGKQLSHAEGVAQLGGTTRAGGRIVTVLRYSGVLFGSDYRQKARLTGAQMLGYCEPDPRVVTARDRTLAEFLLFCSQETQLQAYLVGAELETTHFRPGVEESEAERILGEKREKIAELRSRAVRYRQWALRFWPTEVPPPADVSGTGCGRSE